jgi:hypothetical protein
MELDMALEHFLNVCEVKTAWKQPNIQIPGISFWPYSVSMSEDYYHSHSHSHLFAVPTRSMEASASDVEQVN